MARHVLVLVVVVVAACGVELGEPPNVPDSGDGKGDGTGSGGGPMALTATGFLTKIGTQYCDENFRCKADYPEGANAFSMAFGASKQDCYAGTSAYYQPQLVEQSITAKRVVFNPGAAQTCVAGITYPQSCSQYWQSAPQFPAACDTALLGTVGDGAACVSIFDCANLGSRCDADTKKCVAR
jgi:hypothetical protein